MGGGRSSSSGNRTITTKTDAVSRRCREPEAIFGNAGSSLVREAAAKKIDRRPLIRAQAFGEAVEPDRLERLARYEVHLDRKLERTVAMLLKLQQLRAAADPDRSVSPNRLRRLPGSADV